eukprot:TRINITY_DN18549_c2_g1_i2.p2 TRINITY_DN18549_c2_g1~~TRINITY_DN18549_c2_g1_i2.p2  ORF type:complete len:159 (-),score=1.99 TRINITY_DN18549_c2_g1_i2:438-914(-)
MLLWTLQVSKLVSNSGTRMHQQVKTSLPLQVSLYFGQLFDVLFWLLLTTTFVYKGWKLPYPQNTFGAEFASVILFLVVDLARLWLGSKGNKLEHVGCLCSSLGVSGLLIGFYVYFMMYQVYVLKIEQIFCVIGLITLCLQILFEVVAIVTFILSVRRI